jgi:membrane dipeptidase
MSGKATKRRFGDFDFGLNPEEEARASKLHKESIVIDMLYWGPSTHLSITAEMEKELLDFFKATHDLDWTTGRGIYQAQNMAARGEFPQFKEDWDASGITAGNRTVEFSSWEYFAAGFAANILLFDRLPWVVKALTAGDIRRAKAEGKHAAWINTQLTTGIEKNFFDLLEHAHAMGLRMVMLTYNLWNLIGAGCTERTDAGISNYGANVIERMNELGIIVDTGHCGRQTTLDACELSSKPVIASHTAAQGLHLHPRAKEDEELKALADTGGIIGVYSIPHFIAPPPSEGKRVGMNEWLDHIDYIANLVGWEHVGIGTDWPMALPKSILEEVFVQFSLKAGFRPDKDRIEEVVANLDGFDDYRDFPNVTRGLVKRGYSEEQIRGILGENFLRVFEEVCG